MRLDGCPMDERPRDLASGSRYYPQSNLLNLPLSHYREKKSLSATGTISRQGRQAKREEGEICQCTNAAQHSCVRELLRPLQFNGVSNSGLDVLN